MGRTDLFNSRIGTTFTSQKWLALDACGLFCLTLSFSFHILAFIIVSKHLISDSTASSIIFILFYIPTSCLAVWSLLKAWLTNPGAVPMGARPLLVHNGATTTTTTGSAAAAAAASVTSSSCSSGGLVPSSSTKTAMTAGGATPTTTTTTTTTATTNVAASATTGGRNERNRRKRGIRRCRKCNDNYKPPRAHHDSVTGRCVVKMDHFCPWVGNAVGALNHKFFVLFIFYTFLTCLLSLVLLMIRFIRCGFTTTHGASSNDDAMSIAQSILSDDNTTTSQTDDYNDHHDDDDDQNDTSGNELRKLFVSAVDIAIRAIALSSNDNDNDNDNDNADDDDDARDFKYSGCHNLYSRPVIILLIITISFLFFTCCMLMEQIDAIESNTSKIARMKINNGMVSPDEDLGRVAKDFNEMFGGHSTNVAWHWFIPFDVTFPDGMYDTVMGYEWDRAWADGPYREPEDDLEIGRGGLLSTTASSPDLPTADLSFTAGAVGDQDVPLGQPNLEEPEDRFEAEEERVDAASVVSKRSKGTDAGVKKRTKMKSSASIDSSDAASETSFPVLGSINRIV